MTLNIEKNIKVKYGVQYRQEGQLDKLQAQM